MGHPHGPTCSVECALKLRGVQDSSSFGHGNIRTPTACESELRFMIVASVGFDKAGSSTSKRFQCTENEGGVGDFSKPRCPGYLPGCSGGLGHTKNHTESHSWRLVAFKHSQWLVSPCGWGSGGRTHLRAATWPRVRVWLFVTRSRSLHGLLDGTNDASTLTETVNRCTGLSTNRTRG